MIPRFFDWCTAIVEKEGFIVVTARDGKEAYKLLQSDQTFEAAIFDVVMPYIQGTELVRFMQSEKKANEDTGYYDDGRTKPAIVIGELRCRSDCFFTQAVYDFAA